LRLVSWPEQASITVNLYEAPHYVANGLVDLGENMQAKILRHDASKEYFFQEGCYINELSNHQGDDALSIARARVEPGVTTRLHRLNRSTERYCIISGEGLVEIEGLPAQTVTAGDVVIIPPGASQRISNTSDDDLVFLALCTPRFDSRDYFELEQAT
jgi:mannose-6-phosphate isomerase-like protein (cupin superfamily)